MPSRRVHRKSRHGCIHCKQRRVKCDEKRPRCTNCINRRLECPYPSAVSLTWIGEASSACPTPAVQPPPTTFHDNRETHLIAHSDNPIAVFNMRPSNGLRLEGEDLTFQWFTSTIYTVAHDKETLEVGQRVISKEALSHNFLMHGILAFSALHIAHMRSGRERIIYRKTALKRHNQGLTVFRPLLHDLSISNSTAVVTFSALTMLFTFAYFQVEQSLSPIDDIQEVFFLARGSDIILRELLARTRPNSNISPRKGHSSGTADDTNIALGRLRQRNLAAGAMDAAHQTDVYTIVIDNLKSAFEELPGNEHNYHIAISWGIMVPERYLRLLKGRHPLALIILGHYCVILHRLNHIWWLNNWGVKVLRTIYQSIDSSWKQSLEWPLEQTGIR